MDNNSLYENAVEEVYAIISIAILWTDRFSGSVTKYYIIFSLPFRMRSEYSMMVFNRLKKDDAVHPDCLFDYFGYSLRVNDVGRTYFDYDT